MTFRVSAKVSFSIEYVRKNIGSNEIKYTAVKVIYMLCLKKEGISSAFEVRKVTETLKIISRNKLPGTIVKTICLNGNENLKKKKLILK